MYPPSPVPSHISLTSLSFLKVHLMMEPFCVILKRALSSVHPLHQMLKYHCRDILTPNAVGSPVLLDDGKFIDQLFAFGNSGSAQIVDNGYEFVTWEVTDFRGEIKVRNWVLSVNNPCFEKWPCLLPLLFPSRLCAFVVIFTPSFWVFWMRPWLY